MAPSKEHNAAFSSSGVIPRSAGNDTSRVGALTGRGSQVDKGYSSCKAFPILLEFTCGTVSAESHHREAPGQGQAAGPYPIFDRRSGADPPPAGRGRPALGHAESAEQSQAAR